jgi:large subunit ribosomal protein L9
MEVILLNDVEKVGLRGDVVNVARGYARNYLIPRRLAEIATPAKVAELEKRETQRARHEARSFEQAKEMAETLEQTELRFDVKAGPTGSLFGSVTPTDIADEIWRVRKIRVDRRRIGIDTIKRIGRHEVPIELFQDVSVVMRATVVPEGGELPSEEELAAMEQAERGEESEAAAAEQQSEGDLDALLAAEDAAAEREAADASEAAPAAETPAAADEAPPAGEAAPAAEPPGGPEAGAAGGDEEPPHALEAETDTQPA